MKSAIPNLKNRLLKLKLNYMKNILFSMENKRELYAVKIEWPRQ